MKFLSGLKKINKAEKIDNAFILNLVGKFESYLSGDTSFNDKKVGGPVKELPPKLVDKY